jgi:hypothetical protein
MTKRFCDQCEKKIPDWVHTIQIIWEYPETTTAEPVNTELCSWTCAKKWVADKRD